MLRTFLITLLTAAAISGAGQARARELPLLAGVHRILFLGDSITYAGGYVDYIQSYLETHCSEAHYEIIDMGLPSETVSGLTEPGHAGGAFPRPVLSERLDRVLTKVKPDLIFACYGMNDGIYYPFAEDRFARYRSGIQMLVDRAAASKARLVLLTPPPFDAAVTSTLPAGLTAYPQPFAGYDQVLQKYSAWLLQQRGKGWQVVDIHTPINQYLAENRKFNKEFRLSGDGVHLNAAGHWLIAVQVLKFLGAAAPDVITVDSRLGRVRGGDPGAATAVVRIDSVSVNIKGFLPMPIDPDALLTEEERNAVRASFDELLLRIRAFPTDNGAVSVSGRDLGKKSRTSLAQGISLTGLLLEGASEREAKLLQTVRAERSLLSDAWLTDVGHKRPGMTQGLPLEQANNKAQELENVIRTLAQPPILQVEISQVRQ